jgi:hypothetical protein
MRIKLSEKGTPYPGLTRGSVREFTRGLPWGTAQYPEPIRGSTRTSPEIPRGFSEFQRRTLSPEENPNLRASFEERETGITSFSGRSQF